MSLLEKVGEEVFLQRAQEIANSQPLFSWLGARIVAVGEGACDMELALKEEFMNDRDTRQGTVLFALLGATTFQISHLTSSFNFVSDLEISISDLGVLTDA